MLLPSISNVSTPNPWQNHGTEWACIYNQLVDFHQHGGEFPTLSPHATAESFGPNRNCYSYALGVTHMTGNTALNPSNLSTLKPIDANLKVGAVKFERPTEEDDTPIIQKFQQDGMLIACPPDNQIKNYTPFVLFHNPDPWHCTVIHLEQTTPTINFGFSSIFGHTRQKDGGGLYYTPSEDIAELFDYFADNIPTLIFAPNYYKDAKLHKDIKQGFININVDSPHDLFEEPITTKFLAEKAYWANFYAAAAKTGLSMRQKHYTTG